MDLPLHASFGSAGPWRGGPAAGGRGASGPAGRYRPARAAVSPALDTAALAPCQSSSGWTSVASLAGGSTRSCVSGDPRRGWESHVLCGRARGEFQLPAGI